MSEAALDGAAARLETFFALRVLRTHLVPPLDVLALADGARPYASALAGDGHRVVDAREDLLEAPGSHPDASFDAVLACGPFERLVDPSERERVLREATRALRTDGLLFATVVPRLAGVAELLQPLAERPVELAQGALIRAFMRGTFRPAGGAGAPSWFPYLDEAEALFASDAGGLTTLELRSLRGLGQGREALLLALAERDPARFAQAVELLETTAGSREVLETAGRVLFVGRKRQRSADGTSPRP